jgi:hypothetical protein
VRQKPVIDLLVKSQWTTGMLCDSLLRRPRRRSPGHDARVDVPLLAGCGRLRDGDRHLVDPLHRHACVPPANPEAYDPR